MRKKSYSWMSLFVTTSCMIVAAKARRSLRFPGILSFVPTVQLEPYLSRDRPANVRALLISQLTVVQKTHLDENLSQGDEEYSKTLLSQWNIPALKDEVHRQILRCHKKISKTSDRIHSSQTTIQHLRTHPNVTLQELEACPNIGLYETELKDLQDRLDKLNQLNLQLQTNRTKNLDILPESIAALAIELKCKDEPPSRRTIMTNSKKQKGPKAHEVQRRMPYKRYYTENKTEIRVGKQAEDNDELSCNPEHRDGADWWLHASGCPGSHVVIRCHDNSLDDEVLLDAAALAARQSKCVGQVIKVSLTRCRDVKKPPGAKPGLVQLSGFVKTITVDMKKVESRLQRLDGTCVLN